MASAQENRAFSDAVPSTAVRQTSGLRGRLIAGFLAVALLPFLGISFILTVSGAQSGRGTVIKQLNTILSYKQSAILIWGEALKAELGNVLLAENTTAVATQDLQRLLQATDPRSSENASLRDAIRGRFHLLLNQSQYYDEFMIMNVDGVILVASNIAREGQSYAVPAPSAANPPAAGIETAFQQGLLSPHLAPPVYNEGSQRSEIFISYPIVLQGTSTVGVLIGRAYITVVNNILGEASGLGATGKTYLVVVIPPTQAEAADSASADNSPESARLRILAGLSREEQGSVFESQALSALAQPSTAALTTQQSGSYTGVDLRGEAILGSYLYVPALQSYLLGEQSQTETNRATYAVLAVNASVAISSILIALFLALQITRSIATPLGELSEIADAAAISADQTRQGGAAGLKAAYLPVVEKLKDFSLGWLEAAPSTAAAPQRPASTDEIGRLAQAFSSMTAALAALVEGLEARVQNRTAELQQRSNFLQASAEVSRATASILDPEELIQRSVNVIGETFNLYYVGLFLVDETRQWAILRAGTGEAGRKMLQRHHRLPIGRASMIGWSITNAQPRIAQIAQEDAVRQANPDLPDTRSEAAIPLRSRGRVIGAISVQSAQPNAFDETILAVLQSMADQLAVAIDNANLYAQSQEALQLERSAYSSQSEVAWSSWLTARAGARAYSYRATPTGATRSEMIWYPEMEQAFSQGITQMSDFTAVVNSATAQADTLEAPSTEAVPSTTARLAIPISIRGATIGALSLTRTPGDPTLWAHEEIAFLEGIVEQLAVALDSARLYAETQQKAEQERLVADLTGRIRASLDVETVIKTAAEEIFRTLNQPDLPLESLIVELAPAGRRTAPSGEAAGSSTVAPFTAAGGEHV